MDFDQLVQRSFDEVHIACQVGQVYRMVLQDNTGVYAVLAVLLEFVPQAKRKSDRNSQEAHRDKAARQSSPRSWDVALIPFPSSFAPLPKQQETGAAEEAQWSFPPSLQIMAARPVRFRLLALAEVGNTVSADHLLQMATMPPEHNTTALGIPSHVPIQYQFDASRAIIRSLHSMFGLLATGDTLRYCPQAAGFAKDLCTAARTDNGHILSLTLGWAMALLTGRSTIAVAGVFGAGKTRSLTYLFTWLAITTNLKIGVGHKENPAGRAITKFLTSFPLDDAHKHALCAPWDAKKQRPIQPKLPLILLLTTVSMSSQGLK